MLTIISDGCLSNQTLDDWRSARGRDDLRGYTRYHSALGSKAYLRAQTVHKSENQAHLDAQLATCRLALEMPVSRPLPWIALDVLRQLPA